MLLWVLIVLLTVAVMSAVLWPLWRDMPDAQYAKSGEDYAADIAVYRDQLKEIDADLDRGLIGKNEAVAARTEVSRRLLALSDKSDEQTDRKAETQTNKDAEEPRGALSHQLALYGTAVAVPVLTIALYMFNGSPALPGLPHAERVVAVAAVDGRMSGLIAQVETELRANPDNRQGWEVIAPVYLRQERYDDAIVAYGRVIDLGGETPSALIGLAMAKLSKNNGVVSPQINALFDWVLKLSPDQPEARYWLAVAKEQNGEFAKAAADYRAILSKAPANAPWRRVVAGKLGELMARMGGGQTGGAGTMRAQTTPPKGGSVGAPGMTGGRGPSAADIAAAGKMTAGDRSQMINNMVAGLASRLKDNGNDLPGWQKLVRAYVVLGKKDEAKQALRDARKSFASNAKALATLDLMAKRFKLET